MKLLFVTLIATILSSFSCKFVKHNNSMQNISKETIEGVANDAKSGAVIVTESENIYYIDGMEFWDSKYLNKKIRVTGDINASVKKEIIDSLKYSQIIPEKKIIYNASFELIKK